MEHYISVNGAKIWTDIRGNAKEHVIICTGGPGCCDYLLPVSQMIEDGYSVIRFEQRGCGRSDKDGNYDLHTAIKDMEVIREYYKIESWVVGGHSWGANLALAYAIFNPEKTEAILYIAGNGVQNDREWSVKYHANRDKVGEAMPTMLFDSNIEVNKQGNKSWREFIQTPMLYRNLSQLNIRTLIMCAEADIRSNWPALQIHALMPRAELVYINGAAHYIWLTHADEMRNNLREFLKLPFKSEDGEVVTNDG